MPKSPLLPTLLLCAVAFALPLAAASAATGGTYVLHGTAYRVAVEIADDGQSLTVVEPNKQSLYSRVPGSSPAAYEFTNPTNGIRYGMRLVGEGEIEAYKPDVPDAAPTRLVLQTPAGAPADDEDAAALGDADGFDALAERYMARAQSDPDNAQLWTMCGAAALGRSMGSGIEVRRNLENAASLLKLILTDATGSPCADAIPEDVWAAAP